MTKFVGTTNGAYLNIDDIKVGYDNFSKKLIKCETSDGRAWDVVESVWQRAAATYLPAAPGWRVASFNEDGLFDTRDVVAWALDGFSAMPVVPIDGAILDISDDRNSHEAIVGPDGRYRFYDAIFDTLEEATMWVRRERAKSTLKVVPAAGSA